MSRIGSIRALAFSGTWLDLGGYCHGCQRLLSYGEMRAAACWWCAPETRPPDFEAHLEEIRKRARVRHARGAGRPVPPTDLDAEERLD